MDIQKFFLNNVKELNNTKIRLSTRFSDDFEIRPITEVENYEVKKKTRKLEDGSFDNDDYICNLICKCVVYPDLKSQALQNSYNVLGEKNLIKTMLTAGEYFYLSNAVEEICGFNIDIEKEAKKVKN